METYIKYFRICYIFVNPILLVTIFFFFCNYLIIYIILKLLIKLFITSLVRPPVQPLVQEPLPFLVLTPVRFLKPWDIASQFPLNQELKSC